MTAQERPDFNVKSIRGLGSYIQRVTELSPQIEEEMDERDPQLRTRIHELLLGEDISVLDEVVEDPA